MSLVYRKKSPPEPNKLFKDQTYSVSEFIEFLNAGFEKLRVKVTGEITYIKIVDSGHVYFTLKDEKKGSVLNCIIWRNTYALFGIDLEDGMRFIITGNPELYAPQGKFSFIADTIELVGEGALKKEYERLKAKLTEEGLFEEERKRPIPKYPHKIGIITSLRAGVVMADFMNNLGQFGFKVLMKDARVEGQEAVVSLLTAIKTLKKQDIEVLVIMRGGGSLESMMAFNNETLIRQVVNFPVPVIVAIGHDVDVPLVAMAADKAVSTPTAAANFLSESWRDSELLLEKHERSIFDHFEHALKDNRSFLNQSVDIVLRVGNSIASKYKEIESQLLISFQNYKNAIRNTYSNLNSLLGQTFSSLGLALNKIDQQLNYSEKLIHQNNPEHQLRLGYSIASCNGKVVRSIKDVKVGSDIILKVSDGNIKSEVKNISNK